ncbi:YqiA/YcfP family alpha/beta fold hydrolase [Xylanibacter rodentium]|uniref:Esterase n=1 Tax=Xylanibacter rodentium TaxID=2736289 RepID=A0ABX2AXS3_9BACT|nr:YqiA/YcfP family alpha/beta fold hydrolase [Xylanibacter rodentium]NPE12252.1 esterase [Prevotella sp. PJ1A]NPE14723.1 esterase [Xylanibacter rodentium]NPE37870.1 esterase [Prevotella sp. PCJ2]
MQNTDNAYIKTYPDLMAGKKIMYVHGFGSSGQSGTVARLREMLTGADVIAPDLPIHPVEAMELLKRMCEVERPDLIIGTSMGGMYAEMLRGYDRILLNPAFRIGDDILKHNMLGKVTFYSPRSDGMKEFMMTKQLQAEYQEMSEHCFSGITADEQKKVWGLFGLEDPVVHTYDLFAAHYRQALHFHGEHRMNDGVLIHSVMPVIRWIDDCQHGRQRGIVYICIEETMMGRDGRPLPSLLKAYRLLLEYYDVRIVASLPTNDTDYARQMQEWTFETLGVASYDRLILTNRKDLLYGDYLIDGLDTNGSTDFMSTRIDFGSDTFKTWDDIIEYFGRLGGQ